MYDQQLHSLVFTQIIENVGPLKSPHTDVYSCFVHNCQNLEATKMSFSR